MSTLPPSLAALAARAQFILVKLVPSATKPGKSDKLPVDWRTGAVATAHDPACWMPLAQAEVLLAGFGAGHCLGYVLTEADPLWCLDVDNCVVAGKWTPTAERLFALLPGAAVELSLSRQGLHFWGMGPVPPHKTKNTALGLELYTAKRFIALTGEVLQGDAHADCSAGLAQLVAACFAPDAGATSAPDEGPAPEWRGPADDDALLERMLRSTSAASAFGGRATVAELWAGDVEALARTYPSSSGDVYDRSSADAALAQHLAFWTGRDAARMQRLLARSGLVRDKYERDDYLLRTVAGACSRQVAVLQDAPTAEHVVAAMALQSNEQVQREWAAQASSLPAAEQQAVMAHVANRTAVPVAQLRAELTQVAAAASATTTAQVAEGRMLLEVSPSAPHVQAAQVEQAILQRTPVGSYVLFGGMPSQVVGRTIERLNEADVHKLAAMASVFFKSRKGGVQEVVEHPPAVLRILQHQTSGAHAPEITGVLTHPAVLPSGHIITEPGIEPSTRLFITSGAALACRPYSQPEAAAALRWIRETVFAGFRFATPLDADMAVSGLVGFVQRRLLDIAPGFAALANHQASGKTTLCRVLHLVVTGRELPVMALPSGESEEVEKSLLSILMRGPEAVCFDNVLGGINFHSRVLSQAMTSTTFDARVLGASKIISCPTNVQWLMSGNNVSMGMDEASRWGVCQLTTRDNSGPGDVAEHALAVRDEALRHIMGILAGYLGGTERLSPTPSRFTQWDRLVRHPLMWAGALDPAASFAANERAGHDQQATLQLLNAIAKAFPNKDFSLSELSRASAGVVQMDPTVRDGLRESLEMLGVQRLDNIRMLNHRLSALIKRPVQGLLLDRAAGPGAGGAARFVLRAA